MAAIVVVVYGTRTCEDTQRTREFLHKHAVAYDYVEVEDGSDAEAEVKAWNNGNRVTPTVLIGERAVAEPSEDELAKLLGLQIA